MGRGLLVLKLAQSVGSDVQPVVRHVVEVCARDEPDDFTNLTFGDAERIGSVASELFSSP